MAIAKISTQMEYVTLNFKGLPDEYKLFATKLPSTTLRLTPAMQVFIQRFDHREYPDLILEESEDG